MQDETLNNNNNPVDNQDQNQDQDPNKNGGASGADDKGKQDPNAGGDDKGKDNKGNEEDLKIDEDEIPSLDGKDDKKGDDKDDEYDPYDPEKAKAFMQKQAEKAFEPIKEQMFKQNVESTLSKILTDNPEYKPYEKRIRNFVNHENRIGMIRQGLPVKTVVFEALAPYLEKIGADKLRKANEEADRTKGGGNTPTPTENKGSDFKSMSNKEIANLAEQVKSGRYQG